MCKIGIHTQYYWNPSYRFLDIVEDQKSTRDTNKEIKQFNEECSIETILLAIRQLKEQVSNTSVREAEDMPIVPNISQNKELRVVGEDSTK